MANNIITAVFSSSNVTYTKPAYQYDYGMILKFSGIELPQAYEVHFSNTEFCGESISQIGDESGVTIPDEMFLSGAPIYAWTFLHTGEDDGETVYKTVISINKRAQPSDIEPTPVQQDAITQAIAALNVAVEQTAADVVSSGENAQAAAGSATEASGYANEAKGYAERSESAESEAEGYATRAETAESHAQGYAQTASDKASEASGYASDAQEYADSASSSASDAQGYANDAKGYSESAFASASDASGYASSAYGSAQSASGYASDASSAKDLAVQAKDDAVSAKESAEGFASDASDSANEAKGYAEDAEESAQSVLGLTADATVDSNVGTPSVEVEVITEADHKNMSFAFHNLKGLQGEPGQSGLITDYIAEEKTPYLFRPSANGLANVISEKDMIVGGTVAWNQIMNHANFDSATGWNSSNATLSVSNNVATTTLVSVSSATQISRVEPTIIGHKYLSAISVNPPKQIRCRFQYSSIATNVPNFDVPANQWTRAYAIFGCTGTNGVLFYYNVNSQLAVGDQVQFKDFICIDLTQMFGSTIADYLYTLESGSSGSGIAKLKEWGFFTKDYYPYNSGDLQSVQTSEHRMIGKNLLPTFTESGSQSGITWTANADGTCTVNGTATATTAITAQFGVFKWDAVTSCWLSGCPQGGDYSNGYSLRLDSSYGAGYFSNPDIGSGVALSAPIKITNSLLRFCIVIRSGTVCNNLVFKPMLEFGTQKTDYEPYSVHSYPLDSDLVLRGTLKLDAQNNLRYDGDTYESDGTVTRKYGVKVLDSSVTWSWNSGNSIAITSVSNGVILDVSTQYNIHTKNSNAQLNDSPWVGQTANAPCIGMFYGASYLFVKSADIASAEDAKTYFTNHPTNVIYQLATPTTEQADPYSKYQIVSADGTEEYVDERTVPIPVGHDTFYQQAVDVPQLPTEDGQYQLNLTKVGNTAVASWGIISQTSMVASANIQNGKYFNVGEKLYLASQSISQGETIVVGTNCSEVSLADALNQINA